MQLFQPPRLRAVAAVALALGLTSAAATGCARRAADAGAPGDASRQTAVSVVAVPARLSNISARFELTGSVVPRQQANLSSVISGRVQSVNVQIGDRVAAGELLVQIDASTLYAQLQQDGAALTAAQARLAQVRASDIGAAATAKANLAAAQTANENAQANLRRNRQLLAQGYVSQSAVDQAQSQAAAAEAQLRAAEIAAQNASLSAAGSTAAQAEIQSTQAAVAQAQAARSIVQSQIAQTSITAPFDGIVTQRNVDPGTLAVPGTPLVQVSQLDPAYVNVAIPGDDLAYVRAGSAATVSIESLPGRRWVGRIENVNVAPGQGTLSYLARIAIANHDLALKAGMVASAGLTQATHRNALVVPRGAVAQTDAGDVVYVVSKGKAKLIAVKRVLESDTEVEVRGGGLRPGVLVIVQRPDSLQDGTPVKLSGKGGAS